MKITVQKGEYSILRLNTNIKLPLSFFDNAGFFTITKTDDELSIVCKSDESPYSETINQNWILFKLEGPLGFGMVGVINSISKPLSEAHISIFVISTFDTDYFLVKKENSGSAINVLKENGFIIENN